MLEDVFEAKQVLRVSESQVHGLGCLREIGADLLDEHQQLVPVLLVLRVDLALADEVESDRLLLLRSSGRLLVCRSWLK